MKLAVTVLASILFACSVTTASPVNPSATTSAESSTSTVIPSAQVTPSIDFSKLSNKDMELIKEYAHMKKTCDDAEKIHNSLQPKRLSQQELVDRLDEEYEQLMSEFQTSENGSKYSEKLQELEQKLEQKLEQEEKAIGKLVAMGMSSGFPSLTFKLGKIQSQLLDRLFKGNTDQPTEYYMRFFETDLKFLELVSTLGNSAPNQQPRSEQASTSGTQSSLQHHKSPSSSSEASTVQPTQTSSSTQRASRSRSRSHSRSRKTSRSCSRSGRACSKVRNNLGSGWNQLEDSDSD
ncbi:hypothetical protein O5D80_007282 [Batrachochytrium dendrobatidis]|nr:hypothetical protein O5D80_007282 [Batrachochytrium dendrobatidis]